MGNDRRTGTESSISHGWRLELGPIQIFPEEMVLTASFELRV